MSSSASSASSSQPAELGSRLAAAILSESVARRVCEINPASLELAASILKRTNAGTASYTAVPYHEHPMRPPWPKEAPPVRVLHPSARTVRVSVDKHIGVCDTLIVGAEAELTALRTGVLRDLAQVMQHAAPRALIAMHGFRCENGHQMRYRGPFWVGNLTVPCWQQSFATIASRPGAHAKCHSFGFHSSPAVEPMRSGGGVSDGAAEVASDVGDGDTGSEVDVASELRSGRVEGEYLLCTAVFRANASACARQEPLLEQWAREARAQTTGSQESCSVRKEHVNLKGASIAWTRSRWHGAGRQSLSHMFRRHMRYYSAHPCDDTVCLTFKNEVDEDWIAGLNSSDGLLFHGDPVLVMPKYDVRAQLYRTLRQMQSSVRASGSREAADLPWKLRRPADGAPHDTPLCQCQSAANAECGVPAVRTKHGMAPCATGPLGRTFELMVSAMTHNMAMTRHNGKWLAVGGRHNSFDDVMGKTSAMLYNKGTKAVHGWWNSTVELIQETQPDWPDATKPPSLSIFRGFRRRRTESRTTRLSIQRAFGHSVFKRLENLPAELKSIPRRGLWLARSDSWRYDDSSQWLNKDGQLDEPTLSPWSGKRLIMDGRHSGCVERRSNASRDMMHVIPGVCEYDGRLSLVSFKQQLLLFTRSNPAAHGSRHVQVTRSSDDGETWSTFEQVRLGDYDGLGDIYFFAVQVNPAHDGSLLAIFPLVHGMRGCIAVAASLDGVRWTRVTPLLSCSIYGERTLDQPASPAMVRRGPEVWLYVHEEVPGITIDRVTPRLVYEHLVRAEKSSTFVRYAFACAKLADWTQVALREWSAAYATDASPAATSTPFRSSCPAPMSASMANTPLRACKWDPRAPDTAHSELPKRQPPPRRPYTVRLRTKRSAANAAAARTAVG